MRTVAQDEPLPGVDEVAPSTKPEPSQLRPLESEPLESEPMPAESLLGQGEMVPIDAISAHSSCADSCRSCVPGGWIQADYLMWWPRPMSIPALVTSGSQQNAAVLGAPDTETLLGGTMLNQMFSGARLRLGLWADPCQQAAWVAEGFVIGEQTDRQTFGGTGAAGSVVIARPFFNVLTSGNSVTGQEDAELVSYPNELSGTVTVAASSQLLGVSVNRLQTFGHSTTCAPALFGCGTRPAESHFAGFIGWRYLDLDEELRINEDLTSLLRAPDNGRFLIEDRFTTQNIFNGGELGITGAAAKAPIRWTSWRGWRWVRFTSRYPSPARPVCVVRAFRATTSKTRLAVCWLSVPTLATIREISSPSCRSWV